MFRNPLTDAVVVLVVLLLFFGPKRLPMLSRSIGESIKEFKGGIADAKGSDETQTLTPGQAPTVESRQPVDTGAERSS